MTIRCTNIVFGGHPTKGSHCATSLAASKVPDESGTAGLSCASSAFSSLRTMKEKEEANQNLCHRSNAVIFLRKKIRKIRNM
jgi:hypothetical protein